MSSVLKLLLTDIPTYVTVLTAVSTASYAAYRANESLLKHRDRPTHRDTPSLSGQLIDDNARVLEGPMALAFPVIAACTIIFLFFFLHQVGIILTALSAISGFFSVLFLLWPIADFCVRRLRTAGFSIRPGGQAEAFIVSPFALLVIGFWLFTGNWILNNLIGIALCVLFASLCKVPNLKATVILFTGLFAYDIFFVFFSESFFGRNVMVEVATSAPTNPASAVASFFHLPISPVKNLALPAKLIFPTGDGQVSLLGLGDIILPCILLVYLLEFDIRNRAAPLYWGYFSRAVVSYGVGLLMSFYFSYSFDAAQPALLYIVPCMLFPTLVVAKSRGKLSLLWKGLGPVEWPMFADEALPRSSGTDSKDQENAALIP